MVEFSSVVWLLLAVIAGAAGMGVLFAIATRLREETRLHDLRVETERVRAEFTRRLAATGDEDVIGVDILPEPGEIAAAAQEMSRRAA